MIGTNSEGLENMQIDVVRFGPLTIEEKEGRLNEDLYLYCGGPSHKAINCKKKCK